MVLERVLESQVQHLGMPRAMRQSMLNADLPAPKVPDNDDEVCSCEGECSESDQETQKTNNSRPSNGTAVMSICPCWILAPELIPFCLHKNMYGTMAANIGTQRTVADLFFICFSLRRGYLEQSMRVNQRAVVKGTD